ncbi:MAG: DinB family protein [Thermoanaerobaculia bacterium]
MLEFSVAPSGRPGAGEFAPYASEDIDLVAGDDAVVALASQLELSSLLFGGLSDDKIEELTYAPGRWTFKEVLGHLADDERIFAYRALCIARDDERPLPGFDENADLETAGFESRRLDDLISEYRAVRQASIAMFSGLPETAWRRRGLIAGYTASVRGLAFHIAGHELHHLRDLKERYLSQLG